MNLGRQKRRLAVVGALAVLAGGGASWAEFGAAKSAAPAAVKAAARPINGSEQDYAELLQAAAAPRRILLGESTHGTHEYYRERGRITELLIRDQNVRAVAIEGDWTPTFRVNQYVRGLGSDRSAAEALGSYRNFPRWMWRNAEFRDFVERLRTLNLARPPEQRVGVYGMDVYDLFEAADFAVTHLRRVDPAAAARVRGHYRCFDRYRRSIDDYAAAQRRPGASCERQAQAALGEVEKLPKVRDAAGAELRFAAIRSATSVASAEAYFRAAATGAYSWNVRDQQMARNVEDIAAHVETLGGGGPAKVVMWAHNSHVGDARATDAANRGELNLGQLMRQRHGANALLVGFLTAGGTVFAAPQWDEPGRRYDVRPALAGSHAQLLSQAGIPAFSLLLRGRPEVREALGARMLQRAIGVIYRPESEMQSHYFGARLPEQFDAVIFFGKSRAVEALAQ
jgi:erythromycin esterase-like protein